MREVIKLLKSIVLIYSLLFSQLSLGVEISSLSEAEVLAVKKLGLSETEIKNLSTDELKNTLEEKLEAQKEVLKEEAKEKFQQVVDGKIEPKLKEMRAFAEGEKDELKKDAIKLGAAYITSTISLFAATLIAPQAIMVCKTKPSAVIYAGSAAVYVLQEMRNVKVLKASQLAEIEVVNLDVDKTKSIKENSKMLEQKADEQVGYIKAYKNTIDHAVVALKKKAKNAKVVSAGFLAASAVAAAEQMDWFSGGGACVAEASGIEKINFSRDLDTRYAKLIDEAKSYEDKWARYYEWESLKFGSKRALSPVEYEKLKSVPVTSMMLKGAMSIIESTLLSSALAQAEAQKDTKKVTVAASLKDNKAADWILDLDKLGIAGGLATNIVAYMAGWQMGFLKSIIASGTSRAVVFGAQGALAFGAGKLFEDSAMELEKKLARIDLMINDLQKAAKSTLGLSFISQSDALRFQKLALKMGVNSDKLITEMTLDEAEAYLKSIKGKVQSMDDETKSLVQKFEADLSAKFKNKTEEKSVEKIEETPIENTKIEVEEKTSFWAFFIPEVFAQNMPAVYVLTRIQDISCVEKKSCPPMSFPRGTNANTKILNQYLGLYESYYQAIKANNGAQENSVSSALTQYRPALTSFRDQVFKKGMEKSRAKNSNYSDYERAKVNEEVSHFSTFFSKLSPEDQAEMNAGLNPKAQSYARMPVAKKEDRVKKQAKINEEEVRVLDLLIAKLGASEVHRSGPDMSFIKREKEDEFNFGNTSIHPKESELFDIIHQRYQKFMKRAFPDL